MLASDANMLACSRILGDELPLFKFLVYVLANSNPDADELPFSNFSSDEIYELTCVVAAAGAGLGGVVGAVGGSGA